MREMALDTFFKTVSASRLATFSARCCKEKQEMPTAPGRCSSRPAVLQTPGPLSRCRHLAWPTPQFDRQGYPPQPSKPWQTCCARLRGALRRSRSDRGVLRSFPTGWPTLFKELTRSSAPSARSPSVGSTAVPGLAPSPRFDVVLRSASDLGARSKQPTGTIGDPYARMC